MFKIVRLVAFGALDFIVRVVETGVGRRTIPVRGVGAIFVAPIEFFRQCIIIINRFSYIVAMKTRSVVTIEASVKA